MVRRPLRSTRTDTLFPYTTLFRSRFDFRIVQNAVAPLLGKGTTYRSFGKRFDMPAAWFNRIANWHEFSFLRTPEVLRDLRQLSRQSDAPEKLERLLVLVDGNLDRKSTRLNSSH